MAFGDWLSSTLDSKGWTQAELSRRSKITGTQISRIISGQRRPGIEAVRGIARALEMPIDDVLRRLDGLPERKKVNERRHVVYEVNTDDLILELWRALRPDDQARVRDLMERLAQMPPRIIGEMEGK